MTIGGVQFVPCVTSEAVYRKHFEDFMDAVKDGRKANYEASNSHVKVWAAPKKTFRPWTAEEWARNLGKLAVRKSTGDVFKVESIDHHSVYGFTVNIRYELCTKVCHSAQYMADCFTVNGSPCGVFEEVEG